jgi:hypothetical protein
MQIDPNKNPATDLDTRIKKSQSNSSKGLRFPKWAWFALFIVFGGYAGIKQWIADSPKSLPTASEPAQKFEPAVRYQAPMSEPVAQSSGADSSVQRYAKQLADRNNVQISGEPRYNLEHPMQLLFYPTSDGSAIMCSLKRVECFFNKKKDDLPNAKN